MLNSRYFESSGRPRWTRALAVALTVCLANFMPAEAAGGHWTVAAVDGTAMVVGDGDEVYAASRGQPVMAGMSIATDDGGTVVLVRRGDSITVYPNSEMTIPTASESGGLGVLQGIGKLLFRMETRESRDFEVRTPFLAATIKGTVFTVDVGQTRATVTVTEGTVHVTALSGGRSEMVRPGWSATAEVGSSIVGLSDNGKGRTRSILETADSARHGSVSRDSKSSDSGSGDSESGDSESDDSTSRDSKSGDSRSGDSRSGNSKSDKSSSDDSSSDSESGRGN